MSIFDGIKELLNSAQEARLANKVQEIEAQDQNLPPAIDGMVAAQGVAITSEQVMTARQTLEKYKAARKVTDDRIIENEKWYRLRHWECVKHDSKDDVRPSSAWLLNSLLNKHADAMDNYPSPNVLPREQGDVPEAEVLSSIIPVILEQNDFEKVYSRLQMKRLRSGTGIYQVSWDGTKLNGLGDITISDCDVLSLYWEPGVNDLQESRHLFHVELYDNDQLISDYPDHPELRDKLSGNAQKYPSYAYDDTIDTTDKSEVIDWYYRKRNSQGTVVLHCCKFVQDIVLSATENDPMTAETGLYDHARYPFIPDTMFEVEGSQIGFGIVDVGKSPQEYIDRVEKSILENALVNASPRYFFRKDGSVNLDEFADLNKRFVEVDGAVDQSNIMPIVNYPFNAAFLNVVTQKIDELKETTGNRDVSTGGTPSGVTAAASIAALQEAGSKLSRDSNKASYRAYKQLVLMVIELIRQFYDTTRYFRILGDAGAVKFVAYSNEKLKLQQFGGELRLPQFDVEVSAQKASPYSKMSQNELALQFYGAGFFNPMNAPQALACLQMMDFDRKDIVMQQIAQNAAMMQMQAAMMPSAEAQPDAESNENLGGNSVGESSYTKKARERTAEATAPK